MVDELGKYTPMEPRRSYPVVIVAPERIAALEAEVARLLCHLESLTPGGSEFHNDPARCVAWVRERLSGVIKQVQKRKTAEAENVRLREAINHVEWTSPPYPAVTVPFCPWCGTTEADGHRMDCMRPDAPEPSP